MNTKVLQHWQSLNPFLTHTDYIMSWVLQHGQTLQLILQIKSGIDCNIVKNALAYFTKYKFVLNATLTNTLAFFPK